MLCLRAALGYVAPQRLIDTPHSFKVTCMWVCTPNRPRGIWALSRLAGGLGEQPRLFSLSLSRSTPCPRLCAMRRRAGRAGATHGGRAGRGAAAEAAAARGANTSGAPRQARGRPASPAPGQGELPFIHRSGFGCQGPLSMLYPEAMRHL